MECCHEPDFKRDFKTEFKEEADIQVTIRRDDADMTRIVEFTEHWIGLCRKPRLAYTLQAGMINVPELTHESLPGGDSDGPGSIRRGIGAAISAIKTLNRNRQLLWFTLLAGLVMEGTTICQGALCYLDWIMSDEIILRLVVSFFIEFATLFCLMLLFASLVLSIALKKEGVAC